MAKAVARLIEAATKANERRLTSWGSLEDEADKANERLRKMFETILLSTTKPEPSR